VPGFLCPKIISLEFGSLENFPYIYNHRSIIHSTMTQLSGNGIDIGLVGSNRTEVFSGRPQIK